MNVETILTLAGLMERIHRERPSLLDIHRWGNDVLRGAELQPLRDTPLADFTSSMALCPAGWTVLMFHDRPIFSGRSIRWEAKRLLDLTPADAVNLFIPEGLGAYRPTAMETAETLRSLTWRGTVEWLPWLGEREREIMSRSRAETPLNRMPDPLEMAEGFQEMDRKLARSRGKYLILQNEPEPGGAVEDERAG